MLTKNQTLDPLILCDDALIDSFSTDFHSRHHILCVLHRLRVGL